MGKSSFFSTIFCIAAFSQWACNSNTTQPTPKVTDGLDAGAENTGEDSGQVVTDPDAEVSPEFTWWQHIQPPWHLFYVGKI